MPAGTPPHKAASATPARHRLAMCRCFAAPGPGAPDRRGEIDRGGRSYTVRTLEMLRAAWPGAQLYLAVGSDMLLSFRQWRDWRRILQLAALVVGNPPGGGGAALPATGRRPGAAGGGGSFNNPSLPAQRRVGSSGGSVALKTRKTDHSAV